MGGGFLHVPQRDPGVETARASAARSIRLRASCPTVVYVAVVDAQE